MFRDTQDNEKYSVKHLLFYRAIPPYVIKFPTNNHKVYGCIDCGDRFILESSFQDHINRKSLKISYTCRRCNASSQQKIFYNRCNFLSHIRSHSFKTASINVSDLKIEPLPISFFKFYTLKSVSSETQQQNQLQQQQIQATPTENNSEITTRTICVECNNDITLKGSPSEDRVSHYMKYSNGFHSCPVCLLTLPTICALKSHLRFHLNNPPYFCPECGILLSDQVINYPFNHYCEGFNMIRATVRLKCPIPNCHSSLFHPNDLKKHMKLDHMKKVYKCSFCVVACFSEATLNKHLESHKPQQFPKSNSLLVFYQCEMCPGRLVLQNHLESHVNAHISDNIYPCWTCGSRFKNIPLLIEHHLNNHITSDNAMMECLQMALKKSLGHNDVRKSVKKKMFRVVKRCEQCLRSFSYKCVYDAIKGLPNACPYKCTPASNSLLKIPSTPITCPLCPSKISQQWENVKRHFALDHKNHKCLDCKVTIKKIDLKKIRKKMNRKRNNVTSNKTRRVKKRTKDILDTKKNKNTLREDTTKPYSNLICVKCQRECETKKDLEEHIVKDHRDPYMAYQCMECGECFVVKPSFSTHLLIKHGISSVDDYIEKKKQCYNDDALIISQETDCDNMPLEENQCKICRERFGDSEELEKHFRVHGMAFLIKNAQNKTG